METASGRQVVNNLTRYKSDLDKLVRLGDSMEQDLVLRHRAELRKLSEDQKKVAEQLNGTFEREYQKWYTESFVIIRQLIPNRLTEFEQLYKGDGKRRQIDLTPTTYKIG